MMLEPFKFPSAKDYHSVKRQYKKAKQPRTPKALKKKLATRDGVSMRTRTACGRWLTDSIAAGEMPTGDAFGTYEVHGTDPQWPDWVSVGVMQSMIAKSTGELIAKTEIGRWLVERGLVKKNVNRKVDMGEGRERLRKNYVMYCVGDLRPVSQEAS